MVFIFIDVFKEKKFYYKLLFLSKSLLIGYLINSLLRFFINLE